MFKRQTAFLTAVALLLALGQNVRNVYPAVVSDESAISITSRVKTNNPNKKFPKR